MAPSGRVILVAASRMGMWSRTEATPFGHGRPFTRRQLEQLVRSAELEPTAWSRALYVPPSRMFTPWAEVWEQTGSRLWPPLDRKSTRLNSSHANLVCRLLLEKKKYTTPM